ncbi:hypothetical protein BCR35DRAFT_326729 [Leucosporidium creatinivorum]|uniref:BRCT domain-containing protein n=1 Tax=Leucosporidium creatinivorum TaxID=106004 RepID=A0A1Y2DPU6_9BASI|nr:hypothetical protein BCR35DRAFT_326729 [Leucosporidium creatinivorum]
MMASEPSRSSRAASKKASTSANVIEEDPASQRFVIGKIDAGIAVLISDSVHLIEFPSLLLPAGVGPGSIVNIACSRNFAAEREATKSFWDLQNDIFTEFGAEEPQAPNLRIRNTTQTSVTLEWDKLQLAKAKLLGLSIWRNGQRLTTIPNPLSNTSTKLSGLSLDTDYTFHLVLKTSAGTFSSAIVKTRTHTITDTSGISVCFGHIEPETLLTEAKAALGSMKARFYDKIQIDTTHFVATSPASPSNPSGGPGIEYQKALQLSIPVVSPEWVIACNREQKMVPISNYYIGTVNHAASISSAQLVNSNGQIPLPKTQAARRATAAIDEEETTTSTAPVPAVAPAPSNLPPSELAEEDPETPPVDATVSAPVDVVVPEPEPQQPEASVAVEAETEPSAPEPPVVVEHPEIIVEAPKEDVSVVEEPLAPTPPPTFNIVAPPEDTPAPEPEPEVQSIPEIVIQPTPDVEEEEEEAAPEEPSETTPEVPEIVIEPTPEVEEPAFEKPAVEAEEPEEPEAPEADDAAEEADVETEKSAEEDQKEEGEAPAEVPVSESLIDVVAEDKKDEEEGVEQVKEKEEASTDAKADEKLVDIGL